MKKQFKKGDKVIYTNNLSTILKGIVINDNKESTLDLYPIECQIHLIGYHTFTKEGRYYYKWFNGSSEINLYHFSYYRLFKIRFINFLNRLK